jgi:formylglycine-generating enzyme required for sulfatase activity
MCTNSLKSFYLAVLLLAAACFAAPGDLLAQAGSQRFTNSLGIEFTLIPAGSFVMGPGPGFLGFPPDGVRTREVRIRKPFYLGVTEVTQLQWMAQEGANPAYRQGKKNPVENVSYGQALEFIGRLNAREGRTGYRLPSEAEWEYAARAGSALNYFFGDSPELLSDYAWYNEDIAGGSHRPAGGKAPNPFGLFDILGNVYEWTTDPFDDGSGSDPGGLMVIKGGCFSNSAEDLQSASRFMEERETRSMLVGLRLVYEPE